MWARVNHATRKKLVIHENKEATESCVRQNWMELNSLPHAPATLYPEKEPLVSTE
jgi:hypothetical protein